MNKTFLSIISNIVLYDIENHYVTYSEKTENVVNYSQLEAKKKKIISMTQINKFLKKQQ